jgi:hypothetical protein
LTFVHYLGHPRIFLARLGPEATPDNPVRARLGHKTDGWFVLFLFDLDQDETHTVSVSLRGAGGREEADAETDALLKRMRTLCPYIERRR